jgi:Subtilase family
MKTRIRVTVVLSLPVVMACCLLLNPAIAAASVVSPLPETDYTVRPVCAAPAPGYAGCLALELVPKTAAARAHTHPLGITLNAPSGEGKASAVCEHPTAGEGCFGLRPEDLHSIYGLPTSAPSTQTIALVDAHNDLSAEADLKVYDEEFGLPECTGANECFEKVNQNGQPGSLPFPTSAEAREEAETHCKTGPRRAREAACKEVEEADGWSEEISLDIEASHATCQSCKIVLVEADSDSFEDLEAAEKAAAEHGATEISDSWGGPVSDVTAAEDDASAFKQPGIVVTAAAGDDGYLDWGAKESSERGFADYPASSPHVVAVGGTHLLGPLGPGGTWAGEQVWNGDGAGGSSCSATLAAPIWQQSTSDWESAGCGEHRAVADVAADADPYTGIAMYDSTAECEYKEGDAFHQTHWCTIGGTSLASPLVASVFALAGGAGGVAYPAETLYENEIEDAASLHDIASGSNGACAEPFNEEGLSGCTVLQEAASCSAEAICLAREGYDGPTGVGTPDGIAAFEPTDEEVKHESEKRREATLSARAKLREEERRQGEEKKKEEEEKNRTAGSGDGNSGGGGTGGSGSTTGISTTGVSNTSAGGKSSGSSSGTTGSSSGASRQPTIELTAFALTPTALLALNRAQPKVSAVHFAFTLSAAARVRATLAKLVHVRGHNRWELVPVTLNFTAVRGRNRRSLTHNYRALTPGRYRLTLTPERGTAQTLTFKIV